MSDRTPEQIVSELLTSRGINEPEQQRLRAPDFERDTFSATLLPHIEEAVDCIVAAHAHQDEILIFGDYDADGVPATALFLRTLETLGFTRVRGRIPTRAEGYGLTMAICEDILKAPPRLLITVDNGTTAGPEIALLTAAGVKVVVIDHHEPLADRLPTTATAIVNPKLEESVYPFRELCATAVAWKVLTVVAQRLQQSERSLRWGLDLVGLATIADMVPLVGENRVLAIYGLQVLRKTRNEGVKALAEVAGLSLPTLSARDVGFGLAPRINAPSRMHDETWEGGHLALQLLTATSAAEARPLAAKMQQHNVERQQLVEEHLDQARELLGPSPVETVLVVFDPSWSSGVIGLVASRLVEQYQRPVIALAPEGSEVKGSMRSVEGVSAVEILEAVQLELERFGGHTKAAGLTLAGSPESFREAIARATAELVLEQVQAGSGRSSEGELRVDEATLELASALEELEPFGVGFPEPQFSLSGTVRAVRLVGAKKQHCSFFLVDGSKQLKAIAFSYRGPELAEGLAVVAEGSLMSETWNGTTSPVLRVRHVLVG
jgi:single-stranded-DNA-specific exonuclease